MFNKKICKKCGRKIDKNYEFCPYCGNKLKKSEDWGLLGKEDDFESINEFRVPKGFNILFNSLVKNIDKQFKELDRGIGEENNISPKKGGISISISTSGSHPPKIRVNSFGNAPQFKKKEKEIKKQIKEVKNLPQTNLRNFSKLPREEPSTSIRRLSDRIIYEIKIPGVKSIKNISINRLENSIEIKAVSKNKAYFKLIPINIPIRDYNLEKGKLVLELDTE